MNWFRVLVLLASSFREEHFIEYIEIASKQNSFEIFKEGLLSNILSYFNSIWDFTDTDDHLQVLEMLKADPRNDTDKKWRPTGKSVDEQIRPLEMNKLKWQIKYYEKQIQFQKQQLERAVSQVEAGRKLLADLTERRGSVITTVMNELKEFKSIETQITDIDEKINGDLQR
ncbi:uncharacterized protein LOC131687615 isoform X2 [Topomyia yanbarensis]|uniref:uncharacterized protein LOC131687615 isoform X2 n=1 Tax=Topomyia yanbarensis TaxID=2498891 RepID=UPI00273B040C|nr:uncharacterized protein LOC131687615 isoform X2 [Topomyia yanbarensis]